MGENAVQWLTFPCSLQHASDFDPKCNTVSSATEPNSLAHRAPYVYFQRGREAASGNHPTNVEMDSPEFSTEVKQKSVNKCSLDFISYCPTFNERTYA